MSGNFSFLAEKFPAIEKLGTLAESYLYTDPNTCLIKLGMLSELIVNYMLELDGIAPPAIDNTHANRIKVLKREDMLPRDIGDILYFLRTKRNFAAHEGYDCFEDSKKLLGMAHSLCGWFMQTYGDFSFESAEFNLPDDPRQQSKQLREEYDRLTQENEKLYAQLSSIKATTFSASLNVGAKDPERKIRANVAAGKLRLSEAETRLLIDEQLRKVGWEADSENLRYSKGIRPQKGKNLAIAEWPTDSSVCKWGNVDYALFVGLTLVGVVEAKPKHSDVSSVIDNQCKDYSQGIKAEHVQHIIPNNNWGAYKAPFLFATNGRPYLKQLELKSGIWFRDARSDANIAKALRGWMSPQGIMEMLDKDILAANQALADTPYDLMSDEDGLNLRYYQINAIKSVEEAIRNGRQTALLAMATGTGKTRTVLGLIYRLLESKRFKRVLFLVDRTTLGEQAQDVFKEVKIEDLLTLDNIYNIKELGDKEIEKETKIHVATVQGMVGRIMYNDSDSMPSVSDYDLIVVDEAHRGYILDKELGEDELLYRDQSDYVSKYRTVIEYFDAVKIALTATPALHTTQIFGKPIFEYTYREAVVDGFLVDHDVPHTIKTRLSTEGIKYNPGDTVIIYDPITGEITNSHELEDELNFDLEHFNRQVITENFNRTVLEEVARHLNPEGDGKTLIFAVDDNHADLIVKILKEIYGLAGVSNDAIMKITGSIGGGNPKRVLEAVRHFKVEKYPNIAVTVDLLTTGIDVPEITSLVFLRQVKSRILFEQMLGRATRLCRKIDKTRFEIFDAVGVYDSFDSVSTMKPVVQTGSATFADLLSGLTILEEDAKIKNQIDIIIAKMHRKIRMLDDEHIEQFIYRAGEIDPIGFIEKIRNLEPFYARDYILENHRLFDILNEGGLRTSRPTVISEHSDEIIKTSRGYGKARTSQDYLDEFNDFINDNINTIAALNVVCTRPSELTRKELKSLKQILDNNEFTKQKLNTAWRELKNEDIAADIISYIRQAALNTELLSSEERVKRAVDKLCKNHNFNAIQKSWLDRIANTLVEETVIDQETFETGSFKTHGGYERISKVFSVSGNLETYLQELKVYLYEDGGISA